MVAVQLTKTFSGLSTVDVTVVADARAEQAPNVACVVDVGEAKPAAYVAVGVVRIGTGNCTKQFVCVVSTAEQGAIGVMAAVSVSW